MNNRILCLVDYSYWMYYTLYGAISEFQKKHPVEAKIWIKPAEEVDQSNLPDLCNCAEFTKILRRYVMKRIESIDYLLKSMCQEEVDLADRVDRVFVMDDKVSRNFRKELYPEYKAQRALTKKQYDVHKIKDYITNVIFPELEACEKHGISMFKVDSAEADDVIATILLNYKNDYLDVLLVASDHDYLQIPDVKQVDLMGRVAKRKVGDEEISAEEFLLEKILVGDGADNIPQIMPRLGQKKALKLIRDKEKLKTLLKENQDAAKQFILNKKLVSFNEIPKDLSDSIISECNKLFKSLNDSNSCKDVDLADFMTL